MTTELRAVLWEPNVIQLLLGVMCFVVGRCTMGNVALTRDVVPSDVTSAVRRPLSMLMVMFDGNESESCQLSRHASGPQR
jgi:hypothetical protein